MMCSPDLYFRGYNMPIMFLKQLGRVKLRLHVQGGGGYEL